MKKMIQYIRPLTLLLFISFIVYLSIYLTGSLPEIVPADSASSEFSAERAGKYMDSIAARPHANGTEEIEAIQHYITRELSKMGLNPEIQSSTMNNGQQFAYCKNIAAKIIGTQSRNAVLLVAHYDTVASAPGAADNSMAVAAVLETARALASSAPLKNSVILLFTDGEEIGSLGAQAFIKEHHWAKEVKFVINLDSGGIGGPAFLIDTSLENKRIISEYSGSTPYPLGNEVGQAFQNSSSDFSFFKASGYSGLFLGLVNGAKIHTSLDSIQNTNRRSLQHMGSQTLALTRRFGDINLDQPSGGDASYFNLFGRLMLYYPASWSIPLTVCILILAAIIFYLGRKKNLLTFKGTAAGMAVFLAATAVSVGAAAGFWYLISVLCPAYVSLIGGHVFNEQLFWIAFVSIAVALTSLVYTYISGTGRINKPNLEFGAVCAIMPALAAFSVIKPMSAYIFILPMLFSLIAMLYWFKTKTESGQSTFSVIRMVLLAASAAVTLNLIIPLIYAGFMTSETSRDFILLIFIALVMGFMTPHFFAISRLGKWLVTIMASAVFLVSSIFIIAEGFDSHHIQPSTAFYIKDIDSGKSYWGGGIPGKTSTLDEWSGQFFPAGIKKSSITGYIKNMPYNYDFYLSEAADVPLNAPTITLVDKHSAGEMQTVKLHINSRRKVSRMEIFLDSSQVPISTEVNGRLWERRTKPVTWGPKNILMDYYSLPVNGIDVTLKLQGNGPVRLVFLDRTYGVPAAGGILIKPLPEYIAPYIYASPLAQDTIVLKTMDF